MKRWRPDGTLVRGALVVVVAAALMTKTVTSTDVVAKILSFNVRTSYATEDRGGKCSNWDGIRKENVANQVRMVAPDFVGTQETSDEQKAYLDTALADSYQSIGQNTGSLNGQAGEVDALYYRFNDWTMLSQGMFWLGPNPGAPSADWGMKYYRACVWGRFQHKASGQTVCVFNSHFETPGNDLAQKNGAQIVLDQMKANCDAGDKLSVLMGDLNALRSYQAVQLLLASGLQDPSEQGTFCGNMMDPTCGDKFDWVLFQLTGGACHMQTAPIRQSFDGCYPSDHAVLLGQFCIGGSCCGTGVDVPTAITDAPSVGPPSTGGSAASNTTDQAQSSANPTPSNDQQTMMNPSVASSNSTNSSDPAQANTKSAKKSSKTGTVLLVILGCVGAAGVVFAVVVHYKNDLDARARQNKSDCGFIATVPSPESISGSEASHSCINSPAAILGECQTSDEDWKLDSLSPIGRRSNSTASRAADEAASNYRDNVSPANEFALL